MKKFILPALALVILASCNSKKDQEINELKEQVAYLKGAMDSQQNKENEDAAQAAAAEAKAAAEKAAAEKAAAEKAAQAANSHEHTTFYACGSISVYNDASLELVNGSGHVTFGGQTRQLRYVSYNPSTHQYILGAYLNGSYIGQYIGTLSGSRYKGVFHNVKNGGKVNFDLWEMTD